MKIEQPFSGGRAYCFEDLSIGECFIFEDYKSESGYIYPGTVHMKISKKGSAVRMRDGWVVDHIPNYELVVKIPAILKINTEVE